MGFCLLPKRRSLTQWLKPLPSCVVIEGSSLLFVRLIYIDRDHIQRHKVARNTRRAAASRRVMGPKSIAVAMDEGASRAVACMNQRELAQARTAQPNHGNSVSPRGISKVRVQPHKRRRTTTFAQRHKCNMRAKPPCWLATVCRQKNVRSAVHADPAKACHPRPVR